MNFVKNSEYLWLEPDIPTSMRNSEQIPLNRKAPSISIIKSVEEDSQRKYIKVTISHSYIGTTIYYKLR